ncbi:class I SAM-dependent DNA methyltransferase [Kitasatospora sp. DSM 101779]|uniref:class I SAM-dependent DNA methyltransferase n=1 Tax=Kitasatospora sp. DSM 101779 TaxID=2853165 RepID=UPI0021DAA7C9|nr:class I SAM-dependent methyltransferase [Kitasatospora sp. DSM 101779]MCU7826219.1 class I SAM-dependent methyltransferase [Kitasatospora sp. DSM 101779]
MTESTGTDHLDTTRAAYDAVAVRYTELFADDFGARPLDRAMIDALAELVLQAGGGPVADLGCGPGHVTARLHGLGLDAFGIDVSPAMVAIARSRYPQLRFTEGPMLGTGLAEGSLGGILAHYSLIHTPPEELPEVFAEFHRLLAPGGHLLVAVQSGDGPLPPVTAYDHKVAPAYRWWPDALAALLREAGLTEVARLVREPYEGERTPHAQLLVRRPVAG